MMVVCQEGAHFVVIHAGRVVDETFPDRDRAEAWADSNVDDQMFDTPNWLAAPLKYRDAPLMRVVGVPSDPR